MWHDRLIRLLLVGLGIVLVLTLTKTLSQHHQNSELTGFRLPIKEKIEACGEKVLGAAVKKLPKAPDLEEIGEGLVDQSEEPIEKPIKNIQNLAEELIESIKKLPQDQIEAVKKQIYKKLSEELSGN